MKNSIQLSVPTIRVAIPNDNCSKAEAISFAETLLELNSMSKELPFRILFCDNIAEDLEVAGVYPHRNSITNLFESLDIVDYDAGVVSLAFKRLASIAVSFEGNYCIDNVLFENFGTKPALPNFDHSSNIIDELQRMIMTLAILKTSFDSQKSENLLFLNSIAGNELAVEAKIFEIQHMLSTQPSVPLEPNLFQGKVKVFKNFRDLINCLDVPSLLKYVSNEIDLLALIKLELFKRNKTLSFETDWSRLKSPQIGPKFVESLKAKCGKSSISLHRSILRSIVESHLGLKVKQKEHHLQFQSGNAPQRVRKSDMAKAWRREINNSERLHIWRCPNGIVELASITRIHDEFEIPE